VKPSEAAYAAADIMAERGHCKNALTDEEGRLCLEGALRVATGYTLEPIPFPCSSEEKESFDNWSLLLWRPVAGAARDLLHLDDSTRTCCSVSGYNDHPDTTKEDVVLLLKRAGKKLEEEGK
jgi:hypothetical protein